MSVGLAGTVNVPGKATVTVSLAAVSALPLRKPTVQVSVAASTCVGAVKLTLETTGVMVTALLGLAATTSLVVDTLNCEAA